MRAPADLSGVALVAHDSARDAASPPGKGKVIRVVHIADLEQHLQERSPAQVLSELSNSDSLIRSVSTDGVRCGLVSYRQEWRTDGEYPNLTLDGPALLGVIAAAKSIGVAALWLDAWCYRFAGDYDHADFCHTLHDVISQIQAVIWLPRGRVDCKGEYQYRLWCTFEAVCVVQQRLPVVVAGVGLSGFQRRMRRFGSFTPALSADGTLDTLCRLNLFFYLSQAATVGFLASTPFMSHSVGRAINQSLIGFVYFPLVWLACRATIGRQLRLARNGRRVLRAMTDAAATGGGPPLPGVRDVPSCERLLRELPWLPAYDRRDALVVQDLLAQLRPDLRLSSQGVQALAFSAYHAARLLASPGDESARRTSCAAWLRERDIVVDGRTAQPAYDCTTHPTSIRSARAASARDGKTASFKTTALRTTTDRIAADSTAADRIAAAAPAAAAYMAWLHDAMVSSDAPPPDALRMDALQMFGWRAAAGVSCALVSPVGALAVSPPRYSGGCRQWVVGAATPVRRPQLGAGGSAFLAASVVVPAASAVVSVLHDHASLALIDDDGLLVARLVLHVTSFLAVAAVALSVWVADAASFRQWRMPLPLIVSSPRAMVLTTALLCALFAVNGSAILGTLPALDAVNRSGADHGLREAAPTASLVTDIEQTALLVYEVASFMAFLVAVQIRGCGAGSTGTTADKGEIVL